MIDDLRKDILNKIAYEKSTEKVLEYYLAFIEVLDGITIIKAGCNEGAVDLYEPFKDIPNIKDNLYTPFCNGKVNFFSKRTIMSMRKDGITITANQRRVSFDTQTISYLDRYYKGYEKEIPSNIENVLQLMREHSIGVDYIPYTMENLLLSGKNVEEVADTLLSFERIYYRSKWKCVSKRRVGKVLSSYEKLRKSGNGAYFYFLIYAVLMKMCYIQLKFSKTPVEKKMEMLYAFMDGELHTLLLSELILAQRYFKKGQKYKFFGKIQRNRSDLIQSMRNMTWDIVHLRMLEFGCGVIENFMIDLVVPYFYTYDKRLLEIKECYMLDALAVCARTKTTYPFYSNQKEVEPFLQKQVGKSRRHTEEEMRRVNLEELVRKGEQELLALK